MHVGSCSRGSISMVTRLVNHVWPDDSDGKLRMLYSMLHCHASYLPVQQCELDRRSNSVRCRHRLNPHWTLRLSHPFPRPARCRHWKLLQLGAKPKGGQPCSWCCSPTSDHILRSNSSAEEHGVAVPIVAEMAYCQRTQNGAWVGESVDMIRHSLRTMMLGTTPLIEARLPVH